MCTLSFVPTTSGYFVAMNRDELITRELALPPKLVSFGQTQAIYPREQEGGTWIAANEHGITLALLNWNLTETSSKKRRSRGSIIPQVIGQKSLSVIVGKLDAISLEGILPFRLIGICGLRKLIYEWRWNGLSLSRTLFDWKHHHWFSSGLSDTQAEQYRGTTCSTAWSDQTAGTLPWLRKLHRCHSSGPGPFSICVHRFDAKTVSYTEIDYSPERLKFSYIGGQPCEPGAALSIALPLSTPRNLVVT